jgi:O-antigen/teichoic acid export membrane protein
MRLPALRQALRQLALLTTRGAGTAIKFALSLYLVRYLGLAEVGFYGLLVGASTATPAVLGLGLTPWITRKLVNLPGDQAVAAIFTRLSLSFLTQCAIQPVIWLVDIYLGEPIPLRLAPAIAAIMLLEGLAVELHTMLQAVRRIRLAEFLLFLRSGFWPLPVIAYGLLDPSARTIEVVLAGWICGLVITWAIVGCHLVAQQRWRHLRLKAKWLLDGARESGALYLHDMNLALGLYLDRFLISLYLGLELTGVYTFFWSIANVIHAFTVYGVITPQIATLVDAGTRAHAEYLRVVRRLQAETAMWGALLAAGVSVTVLMLLPVLNRPLLGANLIVFWIIVAATLLRICSDGYSYVLYALRRDDAIAVTSIGGTAISAALNIAFIPYAGIRGAAIAFLLAAAVQWAWRFQLSRSPAGTINTRTTTAL